MRPGELLEVCRLKAYKILQPVFEIPEPVVRHCKVERIEKYEVRIWRSNRVEIIWNFVLPPKVWVWVSDRCSLCGLEWIWWLVLNIWWVLEWMWWWVWVLFLADLSRSTLDFLVIDLNSSSVATCHLEESVIPAASFYVFWSCFTSAIRRIWVHPPHLPSLTFRNWVLKLESG